MVAMLNRLVRRPPDMTKSAFKRTALLTRNRSHNRTRTRPRTRILFRVLVLSIALFPDETLAAPKGAPFSRRSPRKSVPRYADSDGNFVLVVSGSFEANNTKKLVEIVYDPLIEAIQLGSLVMLKFGVGPVGLK